MPSSVLSVAPMMDRTDRHYRYFARQLSRRTLLYTEMVTTGAILHGDPERHLAFDPEEHPIALQLGGDDPSDLARAAELGAEYGYDELNLNVGCPSPRVQKGQFGVCLMAHPDRVAAAVRAMAATGLPVTVKHRIGFDDRDRYEDMLRFVDVVAEAGPARFTVHARKAWLTGLDPKANRSVPPLRYDDVYRLKADRPELEVEINGGITTLAEARAHLARVDAVMVGRAAFDDPYLLAAADRELFGELEPGPTRREVALRMADYADRRVAAGGGLASVTRPLLGLFAGCPGARAWRRELTLGAVRPGATGDVVRRALDSLPPEILDARQTCASAA
jgi:tRNA-dihydrouridine synthase A